MADVIAFEWFVILVAVYLVGGLSFIHPFVQANENPLNGFQQYRLSADTIGALVSELEPTQRTMFKFWRGTWIAFSVIYFAGPTITILGAIQGYGQMVPNIVPLFVLISLPTLFLLGLGTRHYCRWRFASDFAEIGRTLALSAQGK